MAELGEYSEKKRSPKELGISSLDDVSRISNTGSNLRTNWVNSSKDKLNNGSFNRLDSDAGYKLGR